MTAPLIDRSVFEQLQSAVGAEFVVELVETFVEEGPVLLSEMRRALGAVDAAAFRRAAHALKSNGTTFGASRFRSRRALELGGLPESAGSVDALAHELERILTELKECAARG